MFEYGTVIIRKIANAYLVIVPTSLPKFDAGQYEGIVAAGKAIQKGSDPILEGLNKTEEFKQELLEELPVQENVFSFKTFKECLSFLEYTFQ